MKSKIVSCVDCGKEYPRKELNRHFRCSDCALTVMREVFEQMVKREGPYWEKWLDAKAKAVDHYRASMEKAVAHYAESLDQLEHWSTPEGQLEEIERLVKLGFALDGRSPFEPLFP